MYLSTSYYYYYYEITLFHGNIITEENRFDYKEKWLLIMTSS